MNIDTLDNLIISELYQTWKDKSVITTWDIAKKYSNSTDSRQIMKACNKILRRLEIYEKRGYVLKVKNSKAKYILNLDIVRPTRFKFSDGFHKALVIRV